MRPVSIFIVLAFLLPLAACDMLSPLTQMEYNHALSAAEKGDAGAQAKVAAAAWHACYHHAEDSSWRPPCDLAACAKWNQLAAANDDATSQNHLGEALLRGSCGVKRNSAEGIKWYRRAAEAGDMAATENLAAAYASGEDVDRDDAEAAKWYRAAAEKGSHPAQASLAQAYVWGTGVPQDTKLAREWGLKSVEDGSTAAQRQLAKIYLETNPPDYAEAYYWASFVWARSKNGAGGDEIVFTDLENHLTPAQIAAIDVRVADDLARHCKNKTMAATCKGEK